VGRLFRWCDFFDWSFVGFGFFAMSIRNIQEPSDEAGAALLHDLHILGLFQIVEEPVIFRVAHGILHLLSAPTIKQLRDTVYCSQVSFGSLLVRRLNAPEVMGTRAESRRASYELAAVAFFLDGGLRVSWT
jgi:hypothetical protein